MGLHLKGDGENGRSAGASSPARSADGVGERSAGTGGWMWRIGSLGAAAAIIGLIGVGIVGASMLNGQDRGGPVAESSASPNDMPSTVARGYATVINECDDGMGEVVATWKPQVEAVMGLAEEVIDGPPRYRPDLPPAIATTEAAAKRLIRPANSCVEALQELYSAATSDGPEDDTERARRALNVATQMETISERLAETAKEWFEQAEAGEGIGIVTIGWARDLRALHRAFDSWDALTATGDRVTT